MKNVQRIFEIADAEKKKQRTAASTDEPNRETSSEEQDYWVNSLLGWTDGPPGAPCRRLPGRKIVTNPDLGDDDSPGR
jgi:hypothetical protein